MKNSSPTLSPEKFWESRVAESLGISRTVIRKLRHKHLTAETDWQLVENAVVLSAAGVEKIKAALSPLAAPVRAATVNGGAAAVPPGPPERQTFMVVQKPMFRKDSPQRKILICAACPQSAVDVPAVDVVRLKGKLSLGAERPIRVRDNANFIPGMVIEAVAVGFGMWQYIGRLPRKLGRW